VLMEIQSKEHVWPTCEMLKGFNEHTGKAMVAHSQGLSPHRHTLQSFLFCLLLVPRSVESKNSSIRKQHSCQEEGERLILAAQARPEVRTNQLKALVFDLRQQS
jgi:hypothetical protein